MNKDKIRRSFTRSFNTYDDNADVQKQICFNLASLTHSFLNLNSKRVFEIGCGTGLLSSSICNLASPLSYIANDLVTDSKVALASIFENSPRVNWSFIHGDAEEINFPENLDLLTSASAVQWFNDFDSFIFKAFSCIKKDGLLSFSSFGPDNFKEIKDLLSVGLNYLSKSELEKKVEKYFDIIHIEISISKLYFYSASEVLYHMKNTGVTGNSNMKWTRKSLSSFEKEYALKFKNSEGLYELTYQPIIIIAKKKNI